MNNQGEQKHIGLVKWFYDQIRDSNYGFIHHTKLGDLFFHKRSIESGQDISAFQENEIAVFFAQKSARHEGKFEAVRVKHLSKESDLSFLFHCLLALNEESITADNRRIQEGVISRINVLLKISHNKPVILELLKKYYDVLTSVLTNAPLNKENLQRFLKIGQGCFPSEYDSIAEYVVLSVPVELAHELWLEGYTNLCQVSFIANFILSATSEVKQVVFSKCSEQDKLDISFKILYPYERIETDEQLNTVKSLLRIAKEYVSEHYDKILNAAVNLSPIIIS